MSVILFGAAELANVLIFVASEFRLSEDGTGALARELAAYSRRNASAFRATYRDAEAQREKAVTTHDLARACMAQGRRVDVDRALGTIALLRYNLIANSGKDFATVAALHTIITLQCAAIDHSRRAASNFRASVESLSRGVA